MGSNPANEPLKAVRDELARIERESDLWKHGFESGSEWACAGILNVVGDLLNKESHDYVTALLEAARKQMKVLADRRGWPQPGTEKPR